MSDNSIHPRIASGGTDDQSCHEFGRQLAMDSLLQMTLAGEVVPQRRQKRNWLMPATAGIAAMLLVSVGVAWYISQRQQAPDLPLVVGPTDQPLLASGWKIKPTGTSKYRVLKPDCIQLDSGELFVESTGDGPRQELLIQTPECKATATGTQFFIGTYPLNSNQSNGLSMSNLTRVFVLAGMVTLTNGLGSVNGTSHQLLAAETNQPPANYAVQANSDFAVDLYQQLAMENAGKNLFFSPNSLSCALAMTAEGARGQTADEMGKVLRFPNAARQIGHENHLLPWNTSLIHTGMKELHQRLNPTPASPELRAKLDSLRKQLADSEAMEDDFRKTRDFEKLSLQIETTKKLTAELRKLSELVDPYELRTANALWGEKSYPFEKSYVDIANEFYGTGAVTPMDFRGNFEGARKEINDWVEAQTNNRIKELMPPGSLSKKTRLVLTNAIYFKGDWAAPFDPDSTEEADFLADGGKVKTMMMSQYGLQGARYGAFSAKGTPFATPKMTDGSKREKLYPGAGGFVLAELPYKGRDLSMVLLVPQDATGLAHLENKLSGNLSNWINQCQPREISLKLPRFKLDAEYQMNKTLQALGMVRAFTNPQDQTHGAEFDGLCASQDPSLKLHLDSVYHKAFIEVNEKGAEAAAASGLAKALVEDSALPFTPTIRADRPFIFAIRDVKTGTILFLGRVMNPTQ